ncbi:DeoR/GlpR family DNA-binding transcription regulator [Schleiferilactobacillus shenzhenensis]|nr:DeoR/GlpR family DNA-binding transcription regulator [Schleiferilactobacillus shenzhenensis]
MIKRERLNIIMGMLQQKPTVTVNELANNLDASTSTIRRDLLTLQSEGKVLRSYGSAELSSSDNIELSYLFRKQEHEREKQTIAEIASTFLGNNQALFIDSSSTASFLAPYLAPLENVIVITNGLRVAAALDNIPSVKTYLTGGALKYRSGSLLGETSIEYVDDFNADLFFFSGVGVTPGYVFMSSQRQSVLKREMVARARKSILLVDHSKFGKRGFYRLMPTNRVAAVITDAKPAADFMTFAQKSDIEVLYDE